MISQLLEPQITCRHDTKDLKPIVIEDEKGISPTILACQECHDFFNTLQMYKIISEDEFS